MRNLFLFIITGVLAFSLQPELKAQTSSTEELITIYREDYGALSRKYSVEHSEQYFSRFSELYSDWLARLKEMNFEELDRSAQVDYLLLKNDLERSQYFLNADQSRFEELKEFVPAPKAVMDFITQRRSGVSMEGKKVAEWFNAWNSETVSLQSELENTSVFTKKNAGYLAGIIEERLEAI
jgi:hypothetical protein